MSAELGFGTAAFMPSYGLPRDPMEPPGDRLAVLRRAIESGIRLLDTAAAYGDAEALVGQLAQLAQRQGVRVCTKLAPELLNSAAPDSLRRLHCERVHAILAHSLGVNDLRHPQLADALRHLKHAGLAEQIGVSTYGDEAARMALEQPWCDIVQVEHSILNPSVMRAVAPHKRSGQRLVVRSVLCQGLLTARRVWAGHLDIEAQALLDRLERHAIAWGMSLPELAIRFAIDTAGADVVLVGARTLAELEVMLAAQRRMPLTDSQRETLAQFDCADQEWTHPERWQALAAR